MTCSTPVIVALDFQYLEQALNLADQLDPEKCRVKVGKELFTREGPSILKALHERDFDVFLDLKFHDIPNTVARACAVAADMGVWMVNVHASGGRRMMGAAKEALELSGAKTRLIAVTVLTSMEQRDLADIGLDVAPAEQVMRLAKITQECGLHGVVCSAQEASLLKQQFGPEFELVTPGIRPEGVATDDQRRIMTPAQAVSAGVDYMVIGRPIAQSNHPENALDDILTSLR
ncbi:orotidine-5'-phosphate decarboxylase [Ketobacter sp. MCCC 1A13808]|uniref:orotidine-5'-phosphate decarboxylase n=1 Tax=Ketobacter sp. MCCC 1A13808 TaxID=2602738 RepID=UPI0012EC6987|nr:orotidine-5'-phosphate decarboxylase [Ketobacter sp. MCCC 1A13808]MVF12921.1 orotidine-5'-phosphate decarboxylase [Ketobacter sp. MCCC 1A13808]